MKNIKQITAISIITVAAITAFAFPKPKYQSVNILKKIDIPNSFGHWTSKDVTQSLNLSDERYNFISDIFARAYTRADGASLLLLILDAGNFHNPKVCFGSSGYKIKELESQKIDLDGQRISVTALFTEKPNESYVLMYWLCLDKTVTTWTGQKAKELVSSILGRKKAGLMIRLDIPANSRIVPGAIEFGKQFMTDLSRAVSPHDAEYLFGSRSTDFAPSTK